MARYKPYEKYKDSGVEWIGEIPEHWEVYRVKHKFRVVNGATPNSSESDYWDGDILWVTPVDLNQNENIVLSDSIRKITRQGYQSSGTTMIPPGSLILSTRAPIGYVMEAGKGMCTNQGCKSLVKRDDFSTRFFYYHIYSAKTELQSLGRGTTFLELGNQSLGDLVICFPPANEQLAIADYLDHKTSEIDSLIADKEKLASLLQEYRQAIISEAVTKGLNPDVKMKDSGVEWIGEIPEHWVVSKLKYLSTCLDGKRVPLNSEERSSTHGDVPYWGANCIIDYIDGWLFNEELVLLGEDGAPFFDNSKDVAFYSVGKIWSNNHVHVLRVSEKICAKYLVHCLNTVDYKDYIKGSTRDKLVQSEMNNILIQLPSLSEQQAIADYLNQKSSEVDGLITGIRESIAKLKSYRQSLISEAVTGKIDVRGVI